MTIDRVRRAAIAGALGHLHGGVVHRADLRAQAIGRDDIRTEVRAGRWHLAGRHTVVVEGATPAGAGVLWRAVWEAGTGAALDGAAALAACGLQHFELPQVDVCLPRAAHAYPVVGVRLHQRREVGSMAPSGVPRVRPAWATIHAAQWATSDRQAALLLCLPVQQGLVHPDQLLAAWRTIGRSERRPLLEAVIGDVCDGVRAMGELDFARLCRQHGLQEPARQTVRRGPRGTAYLDVEWDRHDLVVEVDGSQHHRGLAVVDDALRANAVVLGASRVLRIPVLGLRLQPDAFMAQVRQGLAA